MTRLHKFGFPLSNVCQNVTQFQHFILVDQTLSEPHMLKIFPLFSKHSPSDCEDIFCQQLSSGDHTDFHTHLVLEFGLANWTLVMHRIVLLLIFWEKRICNPFFLSAYMECPGDCCCTWSQSWHIFQCRCQLLV